MAAQTIHILVPKSASICKQVCLLITHDCKDELIRKRSEGKA